MFSCTKSNIFLHQKQLLTSLLVICDWSMTDKSGGETLKVAEV